MERDTQWFGQGKYRVAGMASKLEEKFTCDELIDYLLEKLALYEDSGLTPEEVMVLANQKHAGLLAVNPCAVGDTVFVIRTRYRKRRWGEGMYDYVIHTQPDRLRLFPDTCYVAKKVCTKTDLRFIGKTAFVTEEEAIKRLEAAKRDARCSATE